MPLRGDTVKPSRFRGPTVVTLRGAVDDNLTVGAGGDIGLDVQIPWSQSVNAFQISRPDGSVLWAIGPYGGAVVSNISLATGAALPNQLSGNYTFTVGVPSTFTLAAPTQPGLTISLTNLTLNLVTLNTPGLLMTGSAAINTATFPSSARGANLTLMSVTGAWVVKSEVGVTFS